MEPFQMKDEQKLPIIPAAIAIGIALAMLSPLVQGPLNRFAPQFAGHGPMQYTVIAVLMGVAFFVATKTL
jgi:hypothetical protein